MRKIIIMQSLLILAGAYYIYTLQQSTEPTTVIETDLIQVNGQTNEALETDAAMDDTADTTTATEVESTSEITGPSDVGMEFPIPDDESSL